MRIIFWFPSTSSCSQARYLSGVILLRNLDICKTRGSIRSLTSSGRSLLESSWNLVQGVKKISNEGTDVTCHHKRFWRCWFRRGMLAPPGQLTCLEQRGHVWKQPCRSFYPAHCHAEETKSIAACRDITPAYSIGQLNFNRIQRLCAIPNRVPKL